MTVSTQRKSSTLGNAFHSALLTGSRGSPAADKELRLGFVHGFNSAWRVYKSFIPGVRSSVMFNQGTRNSQRVVATWHILSCYHELPSCSKLYLNILKLPADISCQYGTSVTVQDENLWQTLQFACDGGDSEETEGCTHYHSLWITAWAKCVKF